MACIGEAPLLVEHQHMVRRCGKNIVEQLCLLGDLRVQTLLKSDELLTPEKAYPEAGPYNQECDQGQGIPASCLDGTVNFVLIHLGDDGPGGVWDPSQSSQDRDAAVVGALEDSLLTEGSLC